MYDEIEGIKAHIDVEAGLARLRGNTKIFKMLLGSFLKNPEIESLIQAIRGGDTTEAASLAHKIKGVTANLSLIALNQAVSEIETRLKTGESIGEADLAALDEELAITAETIHKLIAVLE